MTFKRHLDRKEGYGSNRCLDGHLGQHICWAEWSVSVLYNSMTSSHFERNLAIVRANIEVCFHMIFYSLNSSSRQGLLTSLYVVNKSSP